MKVSYYRRAILFQRFTAVYYIHMKIRTRKQYVLKILVLSFFPFLQYTVQTSVNNNTGGVLASGDIDALRIIKKAGGPIS